MSGATAAHAAYNGTGTQGLAVTNTMSSADSDVVSVFWNKNDMTKQLVYGAGLVDVPPQGLSGGSGRAVYNFDLNTDIDCIGDIFLEIKANFKVGTPPTGVMLDETFDILNVISRIEFKVGSQTWQTLENKDIIALNHTETPESCFYMSALQMSGYVKGATPETVRFRTIRTQNESGSTLGAIIPLHLLTKNFHTPLETFSNITEDGYLMAAAPTQGVRIDVYVSSATVIDPAIETVSINMYTKNIVMSDVERQQILNSSLAKRIKITQNVMQSVLPSTSLREVVMTLDQFSLYASHLIITTTIPYNKIDTVELILNTSSYSGALPKELLTVQSHSLGLYSNVTNDTLGYDDKTYLIFPLASTAYSGSSVPLNRFDNIRLIIKLPNGLDDRLKTNQLNGNQALMNAPHEINVTCVGCTTALYRNQTASISMY
jgi:hypothetical protein